MESMRVLQVFGSLNTGGAETLVMNLYRNIDRNKIQFDFIVHTKEIGFYEKEIIALGGKIYRIPKYNVINHFKYKRAWNNFFIEHKEYKIVHSHIRSTASIILKIAKKHGLKTISHSHNTSNGKGIKSIIKKLLQYKIRKISDYFMGCSYEANKWLFGSKIANSSNCYVLNNGIDTTKFYFDIQKRIKTRESLGIKDELVIGHVGRFCYQKNHEYLIKIFSCIKQKNENAKLLLIGSGELETKIKEDISKLNLDKNVIILNNRKDIDELMCAMDCFVFPSRYEGLGIVVVEAQATGLPCFISDTIPKNVIITPLVETLSISEDPIVWANIIMNQEKKVREDYSNVIIENDYDIKESTKFLFNFYKNIV